MSWAPRTTRWAFSALGVWAAGALGIAAAWGFTEMAESSALGRATRIALYVLGSLLILMAGALRLRPGVFVRYVHIPAALLLFLGVALLAQRYASAASFYMRTPYAICATLGGLLGVGAGLICRGRGRSRDG
jgi:hypothetical protein